MINAPALAAPTDPALIQQELDQLVPLTQLRGLLVYHATADAIPHTLLEIGRLRELVFRAAGAGRNMARDLDDLDTARHPYHQLLVWDPAQQALVALYRYQLGWVAAQHSLDLLRTHRLFTYSEKFEAHILPHAIELGRSVVNPQARASALGFYALWKGLGRLSTVYPQLRYFFGNVSLYADLGRPAMRTIVDFCQQHYPPPHPVLTARPDLCLPATNAAKSQPVAANTPAQRLRALQDQLQQMGATVPPILRAYLRLGLGIWFADAALDADFGDAVELGIVVPIDAIDGLARTRFL